MAKVELTPAKLAELKKLTKFALESNWIRKLGAFGRDWIQDEYDFINLRDCFPDEFENDDQGKAYSDAICVLEFIAAADPATVLAMVEEIEQLTKTSQELFDKTKALEQEIEQIKRQAENNVKHVPYYTGKGPLEQAIEILGTRELNKVIQSRKESEAGQ